MKLPFLKERRFPRVAKDSPDKETLINGSPDDHMDLHCVQELMEAVPSKDIKQFRDAFRAMIYNMFDWSADESRD